MSKKISIKPRTKQILVKPDGEDSRESEYGIITPPRVEQEQKAIGTVLAVGPDVKDIKKGDRVIFGVYAGDSIKMDGVDYKLLHDEDVLAFLI